MPRPVVPRPSVPRPSAHSSPSPTHAVPRGPAAAGEDRFARRRRRLARELDDGAAPIAQQEAAGFVTMSTSSFAGLAGALAAASYFWPDSRLHRAAPLLAVAAACLTVLALRAWLRPPSLMAAPHLVGLNSVVLATVAAAHVLLTDDPFQIQFLLIVVSGVAARVSHPWWLTGAFALCWAPVTWKVATSSDLMWGNGALVLAAATVLGVVVHVGRRRREQLIDSLNARLRQTAHQDGLTGLANRSGLELLSVAAVLEAQRTGHDVGVLFIDLDGFKTVNDLEGHQAGDELLRSVAWRLDEDFRGADVVARIGGDEFVVMLSGANLDPEELAGRCRHALRGAARGASVGCAVTAGAVEPLERLLARADAAMYADKRSRAARTAPGP